ncbi:MAG: lysine 2,3-aminomutase [Kiritimatiellia bacterium]|jgi:lysine 2,3-aminomutase
MGASLKEGSGAGRPYQRVDAGSTSAMVSKSEIALERPELVPHWADLEATFAVRITRSFWRRMERYGADDPLARQVVPDVRELTSGGLVDPVGDAACSPVPWVVHKYPNRALLLLTKRCHLHCRYCFRRTYSPSESADPTDEELDTAIRYLVSHDLHEVILSGGDPLAARPERLIHVMNALSDKVPLLRIHTRAPITYPQCVDDRLIAALSARRPLWMVVHCNHPRELSDDVRLALRRLVDAGITVLNQAVLLRGVNDDEDVLVDLCVELTRLGVKPYYLHHTDRVSGTAHFWVEPEQGLRLHDALRRRVSGLALPRYVIDPPDGTGKVDVRTWMAERTPR